MSLGVGPPTAPSLMPRLEPPNLASTYASPNKLPSQRAQDMHAFPIRGRKGKNGHLEC